MSDNTETSRSLLKGFSTPPPAGLIDKLLCNLMENCVMTMIPSYPKLEDDDLKTVEVEVVKTINNQIRASPRFLKIPLLFIALYFEFKPFFSKGKRFSLLKEEARKVQIKNWNDNSLQFKRDFIKFFRTLALFAFYDHPIVHDKIGFKH